MPGDLNTLEPKLLIERAMTALHAGRNEEALQYWSQAIEIEPTNARAYIGRAFTLGALERGDFGLWDLTRALELDPESPKAHFNLGVTYMRLGRIVDAFDAFGDALQYSDDDDSQMKASVYINRAEIYASMGRISDARIEYGLATTAAPDWFQPYYVFATFLARHGDAAAAAVELQKSIQLEPRSRAKAHIDPEFSGVRSTPEMRAVLGDPSLAVPKPTTSLDYVCRAQMYEQMGMQKQALHDYNSALRLDPKDGHAWFHRGNHYMFQQKYSEALSDYNRAAQLDSHNAELFFNRGVAHTEAGNAKGALSDYDRAISLTPGYFDAYLNRGVLQATLGNHAAALADLSDAVSLRPGDSRAYVRRGFLYILEKDLDNAFLDYDTAISLDPLNSEAYLRRGLIYGIREEFEKSHPDYQRAVELDPTNDQALYLLAASYGRMFDPEKSASLLTEAIRLNRAWRDQARGTPDFMDLRNHPAMSKALGF